MNDHHHDHCTCCNEDEFPLIRIPELAANPVTQAFVGLVLLHVFNCPHGANTRFTEYVEPFGPESNREATKYVTVFLSDAGIFGETFIIFNEKDIPVAVATRFSSCGLEPEDQPTVFDDNIGYYQFEYNPYDQDEVIQSIKDLPTNPDILDEMKECMRDARDLPIEMDDSASSQAVH